MCDKWVDFHIESLLVFLQTSNITKQAQTLSYIGPLGSFRVNSIVKQQIQSWLNLAKCCAFKSCTSLNHIDSYSCVQNFVLIW